MVLNTHLIFISHVPKHAPLNLGQVDEENSPRSLRVIWLSVSLARSTCAKEGKQAFSRVQGLFFEITGNGGGHGTFR